MAKLTDAFPSNFLRASDIPDDRDTVVTIESVSLETLGQGRDAEQKFIVSFVGKSKKLVLNKTNFKAIVSATGVDDSDDWGGHKIALFVMDVEYQGDLAPAIRVRPRAPGAAQAKAPIGTPVKSEPKAPAPKPAAQENLDEDVPF